MRINYSRLQTSFSLVAVLLWNFACGSAPDMRAEDEPQMSELSAELTVETTASVHHEADESGAGDERVVQEVETAAPDTTTGSATDQPSVLTESSPSTPTVPFADVVNIWLFQIGLQGPSDLEEWRERLERVCDAPIWEAEAAARITMEFVLEDGGDPTQPGFLQEAVFALWTMARQPVVCGDRFPPGADYPPSVG